MQTLNVYEQQLYERCNFIKLPSLLRDHSSENRKAQPSEGYNDSPYAFHSR
jgi:hypothetical protein